MNQDKNKSKKNSGLSNEEEMIFQQMMIKEMKAKLSSKMNSGDSSIVIKSLKSLMEDESEKKK